ncbi:ErfK/YbiS/YcfS/YnhG family protein [Chthoniobacter flavus Ellin428]|uniref:ErfK/YbiS/YcfS/YnhG family protein n=1 Tax=Chthoniobacter flavus Ellin428 TaxID=497964 RepID=B4CTQ4_9BACT|nr:L,D-transpeptidase [Chthoniobacter flavus]EDY21942.1 ErfK/YbiS/YcfS/YnhG family protein [Chthoniobacter flavus Ellin428]TCO89331.1 L,D-transpeptidase-like protein [Chthoniobacter flavus]
MQGHPYIGAFIAAVLFASVAAADEIVPYVPQVSIVISIPEQKLTVLKDGCFWKKYPISTSKYGSGDSYGSYKTPVGNLRVCEKIGEDLASGAVIKKRHATGEVLPANSPGRDPIVTRILWLEGLEEQNHNARARGIYIHGTTEEEKLGKPVSYGCIRMRSKDVLEVFDDAAIDTPVSIITDKFPHYAKYVQPKPQVIVSAPAPASKPAAVAVTTPAPVPSPAPAAVAANTRPASKGTTVVVEPTKLFPSAPSSMATNSPRHSAGKGAMLPPVADFGAPIVESESHSSFTVSNVSHSTVAHAMEGSMLSAGLPNGPKIETAPKDVTRFGQLAPNPKTKPRSLSLDQ